MRIAREAWPLFLPPIVLAALALVLNAFWWSGALAALGLFVLFFFRDPRRHYDGPPEVALSPADGRVISVDTIEVPEMGPGRWRRVATFLSVFNVHVQRSPTEGDVVHSALTRGKKHSAFRPGIDLVNENQLTVLRREEGENIGIRQIAGLIARRIVADCDVGDRVRRRDRLGLIRFGSRVDLLVPLSYEVLVQPGQRVRTGVTPMAIPTDPSSPPPADQPVKEIGRGL